MEKSNKICEKHGEYVSSKILDDIWTSCPKCSKEKSDAEEAEKLEKGRIEAESRKLHVLRGAGIQKRFMDKTLANYSPKNDQAKEVYQSIIEYAKNYQNVLENGTCGMMLGMVGTGKTHLACGLVRHYLNKGYKAKITRAAQIIREIRETWGGVGSESEALARFTKPDFLVVDEIGVQMGTENERNLLFEVFNQRYDDVKPTVIISNHTSAEVEHFIGQRIFDRMREGGGQKWVFDWDSNRA